MKNIALPFIIVFLYFIGTTSCSVKVPGAAKSNLGMMFPEATQIRWSYGNRHEFEAEFTVQEALSKDFADFVVHSPEKLSSPEYAIAYEMIVVSKKARIELLFSQNGDLLKKELLKDDEDVD